MIFASLIELCGGRELGGPGWTPAAVIDRRGPTPPAEICQAIKPAAIREQRCGSASCAEAGRGRTQDKPNLVDPSPSSRRGHAAKSIECGEGAQLQGVLLRSGRLRHVRFDHSVSLQELPCDNANRMRSIRRNRSLSCRRKLRRAGSESIEDAPRVRHRREGSAKTRRKAIRGRPSSQNWLSSVEAVNLQQRPFVPLLLLPAGPFVESYSGF